MPHESSRVELTAHFWAAIWDRERKNWFWTFRDSVDSM